jgi:carboxyl-terminal processing protease
MMLKLPGSRKQVLNLLTLLVICTAWFAIGWIVRGLQLKPEIGLIEQVRQRLLSEHVGETPPARELSYAAIRGMLGKLQDPYSALIPPPISYRFSDDFAGRSGVIGLFPEKMDGRMVVSVVFPGESAYEAGLREGDIILSIDGIEIDADTSNAEVILLVRGPVGEPAHFVVQRGDEILEFFPVRQERTIVSARMLPAGIAYIAQYTFTTNATAKMKEALLELLAQNPKSLIWDLSSNGGGSMETARDILSYFIKDGLLFSADLKGKTDREFRAWGTALAPDIPLVVLVGKRTYSAAETAAAAIAETGRGIVIGSTTYGKGVIQATYPLDNAALLQLTIAKWLSPTGQWYHGRGVAPQIEVIDNPSTEEDEVLQFAIDYLLHNSAP